MKQPCVLNKRHGATDGVYIGRPSKWGNPFLMDIDGNRLQVVERYRNWLLRKPELVADAKRELRGKNLICWCAPLACHGDVLLAIANSKET